MLMRPLILLSLFLALASVADDSPAVLTELAEMVEAVVRETGMSININGSEEDSVNIDTINGRSVCSDEAFQDVQILQEAFNRQKHIRRNFGPAFFSVTFSSGERKFLDKEDLVERGVIEGCMDIYVSIQNGHLD